MATQTRLMTAEELLAMPEPDGTQYELVQGELITMAPAGDRHGDIGFTIANIIGSFIKGKRLGKGYNSDTGFILRRDPDTVRAPDVAFVVKERVQPGSRTGYYPGAPDFAVEVISPSNSASEIVAKVDDYIAAGTRLIWVVYPDTRSVMVYRPGGEAGYLHEGDELDGRPVFDDFRVPVSDLFEQE